MNSFTCQRPAIQDWFQNLCFSVLAIFAAFTWTAPATAAESKKPAAASPEHLRFIPAGPGEFSFDTGVLRGRLGSRDKGQGLSAVTHIPTGASLDRSMGLLSHYRVFTKGKRYGAGAWDWPFQSQLLDDGSVQMTWLPVDERPFQISAVYRWLEPATIQVETTVKANKNLPEFEVFLASYFDPAFASSQVYVKNNPENGDNPGFLAAKEIFGAWQMFPRDDVATALIQDGRWKLPPNPVEWTIMPQFNKPVAIRHSLGDKGLTAVLMASPADCFAIATPHQTEGHCSLYFSLFGRTIPAGESAHARVILTVAPSLSTEAVFKNYRQWFESAQ